MNPTHHMKPAAAPQTTANYQFMPLPGVMFGDPADKAFRVAPRWATLSPEQGVLDAGASIDVHLQIHVFGGPQGCAEALATSQARCLTAEATSTCLNIRSILATVPTS